MFSVAQKPILGQTINWEHPLVKDLIGCWLFNEQGGDLAWNLLDMPGVFAKDSTVYPIWNPNGVAMWNYGYIDSRVVAPFNIDGNDPMSVMCMGTRTGNSNYDTICGNQMSDEKGWYLRINLSPGDDKPLLQIGNSGSNLIVVHGNSTVSRNQPYQLIMTYSGGRNANNVIFYINGIAISSIVDLNTLTQTSVSSNSFNIGRIGRYVDTLKHDGLIYSLYVWKRALSAEEVRWLYAEPYCFIQPIRPSWLKQYISCPLYSRGNYADLPGTDANLETTYSAQDYIDVESDDGARVAQSATAEYTIHQFKECIRHSANSATIRWNGQSTMAPANSEIFLQIYNYNTDTWDTIDSDNITGANTDFDLEATVADLTDYKDTNDIITCRVYQLAQ